MAERRGGAGPKLAEVLERSPPHNPTPIIAPNTLRIDVRPDNRIKGRTIYLPDDLFERIPTRPRPGQRRRRDRGCPPRSFQG
jgi:hypothetical protein